MFQAKHIMTTDPVTIRPEDTTDRAIELLLEHGLSGLPVVDEQGAVLGMLTEYDLLELVFDCWTDKNHVRDYMSCRPCTVGPDDDWVVVADRLRAGPYRPIPVIDNGKLVGMISRRDLLRKIHESHRLVREVLAQQPAAAPDASSGQAPLQAGG